ncbi:MAG: WXG100 family type VII secretion target [Phycisphaeraceae bacterium]|nr:WXG100 family type VII secretion target [Phycisphaeraceae bacterium]
MSKAVVDPGELRRFANDLRRFNSELQSQMKVLHGRMLQLSQTWRDQEQTRFAEAFEETMRVLLRFTEASEQHVPFLLRKADRIDDYLQQR